MHPFQITELAEQHRRELFAEAQASQLARELRRHRAERRGRWHRRNHVGA